MAEHRGLTVRSLLAAGPVPKASAQGSVISHRAGQVVVAEVRGEPQEEEKVCLFVRNRKIKQMTCWDVVKWAISFYLFLCCLREKKELVVKIQPAIKAPIHPKLFKDRTLNHKLDECVQCDNRQHWRCPLFPEKPV